MQVEEEGRGRAPSAVLDSTPKEKREPLRHRYTIYLGPTYWAIKKGVVPSLAEGGIDKTPELIIWPQRRPPSLS